ncbi:RND transporter [Ferrigenium kumadai]|uniref:RND transporter n=1 Tax=Ferrigenium kumadai TaxID=1682490 RepID=A0AAN1T279_9PROT|nr:efflux transporter outer membrane subunit [Ferrigenium kumadai]BBJ00360.1 RND transporter [Ferrigenium kumadai]
MRAMAVIMLGAGMLAACSVGPEYKRPDLDVPGAYRFQDAKPGGASIADLGWWEVYRDKQLQGILQAALENNRDIKTAAARVAEARAQVGVSRLDRFPRVDVTVGDTRQRTLQVGRYSILEIATGLAQVSFEVDLWKRLASLSDAAKANLLATEYARDAVKVTLVSDVAVAYFNLLALDQQLRITQSTIANSERFLALTQAKSREGAASGLDVSRAEASLASVKANQSDIQRQIAQTENQMQILLGKNPDTLARGKMDETSMAVPPEVPAGLPSALLERRPDLRQAEAGLIGATANVRAAKAALFPTLSLTGSYGSQSLAFSSLFSGGSQVWSYGLNFLQPILDSQRNGYQVDAAKAREQQALLQYQSAVAQAFREVSDALVAWQSYNQFLRDQEQQVKSLQEANSHVLRRYEIGYSSYFEVIDASNSLYAAELQRVQAYRNSLVSLVQLYKALGGGWAGIYPDQPTGKP